MTINASEWIEQPSAMLAGRATETMARFGGLQYDAWHSIDVPTLDAHYLYNSCPGYNATITVVGTHDYDASAQVTTETQGNVSMIVYGVEDPAGNIGDNVSQVSRTTAEYGWVTIDTVVPVLTWVDIISNNVKHSQLAKEGDTIFMTINASEWIEEPSVIMSGRPAESLSRYGGVQSDAYHMMDIPQLEAHYLYGSCPSYNATISVVGTHLYVEEEAVETQGNVSMLIYGVEDPAGNAGSNISTTTRQTASQGWVVIDTVVPLITWVDVMSNNAKHRQLAKEGDTIFMTINASEWIEEPSAKLADRSVEHMNPYGGYQYDAYHSIDVPMMSTHYLFGSCPSYNATVTVYGTHLFREETPAETQGNVSLQVWGIEDPAGNVGVNATSVTRETAELGWVTIDTVVPLITWVDIISNNAKHTQLAKEGDTIFMTINASEWIEQPLVTMAGRNAESMLPYGDTTQHDVHYLYNSCPEYNATITIVGTHLLDEEDAL